jgi:hypothetical protein
MLLLGSFGVSLGAIIAVVVAVVVTVIVLAVLVLVMVLVQVVNLENPTWTRRVPRELVMFPQVKLRVALEEAIIPFPTQRSHCRVASLFEADLLAKGHDVATARDAAASLFLANPGDE